MLHYWCAQHNFLLKCWETWKNLAFIGKCNPLKRQLLEQLSTKTYISMFHYWYRHHNFLLKRCKTWKNLVFVGKYNSFKTRSLKHLSTKTYISMFHYWCGQPNEAKCSDLACEILKSQISRVSFTREPP